MSHIDILWGAKISMILAAVLLGLGMFGTLLSLIETPSDQVRTRLEYVGIMALAMIACVFFGTAIVA